MPMWLLKKEKEKKAAEGAKAKGKASDPKSDPKCSKDSTGSDADFDPRCVDSGPASPGHRRRSGGDPSSPTAGGPMSPVAARPRRMSFDASANADLVKNALGDVNNIIAKAAEQQKEGARPRRASFSGTMPGAPEGPSKKASK